MQSTKEIEIPKEFQLSEWQTTKIKIRKWNLRIRNKILDEVAKFQAKDGGKMTADLQGGWSELVIITNCVIEAPWRVGEIDVVGELEPEFGDWLYGQINELNSGLTKHPQGSAES